MVQPRVYEQKYLRYNNQQNALYAQRPYGVHATVKIGSHYSTYDTLRLWRRSSRYVTLIAQKRHIDYTPTLTTLTIRTASIPLGAYFSEFSLLGVTSFPPPFSCPLRSNFLFRFFISRPNNPVRGLESAVSFPSGVWRGAPAENAFCSFFSSKSQVMAVILLLRTANNKDGTTCNTIQYTKTTGTRTTGAGHLSQ